MAAPRLRAKQRALAGPSRGPAPPAFLAASPLLGPAQAPHGLPVTARRALGLQAGASARGGVRAAGSGALAC